MNNNNDSLVQVCSLIFFLLLSPFSMAGGTVEDETEALKQKIGHLEQELAEVRKKLVEAEAQNAAQAAVSEAPAVQPVPGPVKIGGTFGINYVYGDYDSDSKNYRMNEDLGDVDLELFRLNADLDADGWIGRVEYRWYDTYSMMHTAWLGYASERYGTLKAGIVRVPFGPGPYGVSTSWFFDQHFYIGLSDDMDLGVRWTKSYGDLDVDLAYYFQDEGEWDGASRDSSRFSYDPVTWDEHVDAEGNVTDGAGENGFEEDGQLNLRMIYSTGNFGKLGASFQYGWLDGKNVEDSGANHFAVSAHAENAFGDFTLLSQLTYYEYDITDDTPWGTGDLIPMGAYDFAWLVASEGWIPAVSLRYHGIDTSGIPWIDSIMPFIEWSTILKEESGLNDSTLWSLGALMYWDQLYVYAELGISDGNNFVGDEGDVYDNIYDGVGDVGANGNDRWNKRFNINVRYYFSLFE